MNQMSAHKKQIVYDQQQERKRRELGFESTTLALLSLGDGTALRVSMKGDGCECVPDDTANQSDGFISFKTDPRLLLWLLKGPQHATGAMRIAQRSNLFNHSATGPVWNL